MNMSSKRYTEEFKIETVRQVVDRGYSIAEVADRLGTTSLSGVLRQPVRKRCTFIRANSAVWPVLWLSRKLYLYPC